MAGYVGVVGVIHESPSPNYVGYYAKGLQKGSSAILEGVLMIPLCKHYTRYLK
jgi:hypothetical protein